MICVPVNQTTKFMSKRAFVIWTFIYAFKLLYERDIVNLKRFHQMNLCLILRTKCQERITTIDVFLRAMMEGLETITSRHLSQMPDICLPKQILFSELKSEKRSRGARDRRFQNHPEKRLAVNRNRSVQFGDGS